jgi:hypothetical protein
MFTFKQNQNIIRLKESKIENGMIYCLVERDAISTVDDMTFDLTSQAYHLLIASGSTATEISIGYHDINRAPSSEPIFFIEDESVIIEPSPEPTTTTEMPSEDVYDECGKTKTCFGLPNGCVVTKSCVSFGAVIVKSGTYRFEMQSSCGAGFIAMALSDDNKMGSDSAIECVNDEENVGAYTSVTRAIPNNYGARRIDIVS